MLLLVSLRECKVNVLTAHQNDDQQLTNLMADEAKMDSTLLFGQSISGVANRLDALMMVTKTCKESSCTQPWKTLHPDGSVTSLEDALDSRFDEFYRDQVKVSFSECKKGQLRAFEGPQESDIKAWGDESAASSLKGMPINLFWQW